MLVIGRLQRLAQLQRQTRMSFATVAVEFPAASVANLVLRHPPANAMNNTFWGEMAQAVEDIGKNKDVRVLLVSGAGKHFTAGLDLADMPTALALPSDDVGRNALHVYEHVRHMQRPFDLLERLRVPVIACVHGACIGAGLDLISACDIRFCSKDAFFSIKEIDVGLAADLGTLQRLPKVVGNQSFLRELAMTGRNFSAAEASHLGLVSRVFESQELLMKGALELAQSLSQKSPIAMHGTKHVLNYSRDHSVDEGTHYVAVWNAAMLQSKDVSESMMAKLEKRSPSYAKL